MLFGASSEKTTAVIVGGTDSRSPPAGDADAATESARARPSELLISGSSG